MIIPKIECPDSACGGFLLPFSGYKVTSGLEGGGQFEAIMLPVDYYKCSVCKKII